MGQDTRFDEGKRFLQSLGFDAMNHSRRTLFDHLVSTGTLLREWGCPEETYLAGLFHAVYGTETFRYQTGLIVNREPVQNVIGAAAERLAWLFGISTGKSLWSQFAFLNESASEESTPLLVHRITAEALPCDRSELRALANITLANALDQAHHLPGRYDGAKLAHFRPLLPYVLPGGRDAFNTLSNERKIS